MTVSIHAPLARGDILSLTLKKSLRRFNPRPSCEGRLQVLRPALDNVCFNPRPSCEGRRKFEKGESEFQSTPLLRGATFCLQNGGETYLFQSTPSCEGRLYIAGKKQHSLEVSIHAPLARGDCFLISINNLILRFNPRPSCEGRLMPLKHSSMMYRFQSTPLLRGATADTAR